VFARARREGRVEAGPLDLEGGARRTGHRLFEAEDLQAPGALAHELRAALEDEEIVVRVDAELLQDGRRGGQERLADVKPREPLLLEHEHAVTALGEKRRRGRARGPRARHDYVPTLTHDNPPSMRMT